MAYTIFRNPGGKHFLFDREVNRIYPIDPRDAKALAGEQGGQAKQEVLCRFQQKGVCLPTKLEEIEHPGLAYLEQYLDHQLNDMVLQVTQSCNLRCEYCSYSGNYYSRTHSVKHMSFETACKAIDFFVAHSTDQEHVNLGFYGGEPLLEFRLIQRVIDYIESNYPGKEFQYMITTNATLLTEDVVEYLIEKDIHVMISLDGPKELHDAHRRFSNGEGSFDLVKENLSRIRAKHPDFFQSLRTNSVLSPNQDYEKLRQFFDQDELFSQMGSQFTMITDVGAKDPPKYGEDLVLIDSREQTKLFLYLLDEIDEALVSKMARHYIDDLIFTYKVYRDNGGLTKKGHPGGPCIAGARKTFVDVDGRLFPCERVGETETTCIGSLDAGFDLDQVKKILNVGALTQEECTACWAFAYCGMCVGQAIEGTRITRAARLRHCTESRASAMRKLQDLTFLVDHGVDFEKIEELNKK